jgi:hypothetical protein
MKKWYINNAEEGTENNCRRNANIEYVPILVARRAS